MTTVDSGKTAGRRVESRWPDSMETCLEENSLASLVVKAVRRVDEGLLQPVAGKSAGVAYQPRQLLALVTYCYAAGIYPSQDIEDIMRKDRLFRFHCENEFPDWHLIRRFRRHNRELIQQCLAEILGGIWLCTETPEPTDSGEAVQAGDSAIPRWRLAMDWSHLENEANERINLAILSDSMATDE